MEEYFWVTFAASFVLLSGLILVLSQYLRSRANLRLREMLHREMVLAMEKNVPLPEITSLAELGGTPDSIWPRIRRLLPAFSLGAGLVLAGTGLGIALAFALSSDRGLNQVWTLGLIPLFAGIGFLLYHFQAGRATS